MAEFGTWTKIEDGCEMPEHQQEVIVTIWQDCSYGRGKGIESVVCSATYDDEVGYIDSANGVGGFDTENDWHEGQPIWVTAWMPMPDAFLVEHTDILEKLNEYNRKREGNYGAN